MRKKALLSCFIGNLFDHYDTAVFALIAPFIAREFFPHDTPLIQLIKAYAILPLGMVARPFGAWFFGRLADRKGRQTTLFYTLSSMGLISFCMAILPGYERIGVIAPTLLLLFRLLQNFFTAGETMPGAIFVLERTKDHRRNFFSSLYSCSTLGGILFASLLVSLFSHYNLIETGWRLLFLLGVATALFGAILRKTVKKEFTELSEPKLTDPLKNRWNHCWTVKGKVFKLALISSFYYSTYQIGIIFLNGFAPKVSHVTQGEMSILTTYLLFFPFLLLPFIGYFISSEWRETWMKGACLVAALISPVALYSLSESSYSGVVLIRLFYMLLWMAFSSTIHAWYFDEVDKEHRTEVLSFSYAIGSQTIGGWIGPMILLIYERTGSLALTSIPYCLTALCVFFALHLYQRAPAPRLASPEVSLS